MGSNICNCMEEQMMKVDAIVVSQKQKMEYRQITKRSIINTLPDQKQLIGILSNYCKVSEYKNIQQALKQNKHDKAVILIDSNQQLQQIQSLQKNKLISRIFIMSDKRIDSLSDLMNKFQKISNIFCSKKDLLYYLKYKNIFKVKKSQHRNILLSTQSDIQKIKKQRYNYSWMVKDNQYDHQIAFNHLREILIDYYPQQVHNIQTIINKLQFESKSQQFWKIVFQKNFLSNWLEIFPKITTKSTQICYIRQLYYLLNKQIRNSLKITKEQNIKQIFVVMQLTKNQRQSICVDRYLTFTTFIIGFTDISKANKKMLSCKNNYFFTIKIQKNNLNTQQQSGFYYIDKNADNENVIFNLVNYFLIKEIKQNYIELQYLNVYNIKKKLNQPKLQSDELCQYIKIVINFENYLKQNVQNVSQASCIYLQTQKPNESIKYYYNKIAYLKGKRVQIQLINQSQLQLANFYLHIKQFQKSKQLLLYLIDNSNKESIKIRSNIYLAELYYAQNDLQNFEKCIQLSLKKIQQIKSINLVQAYQVMNYIGVSMINNQKNIEAEYYYRQLYIKLMGQNNLVLQGTNIYNDVLSNLAICISYKKLYKDAENLMKIVLDNIKQNQGKNKNYSLIQSKLTDLSSSKPLKQVFSRSNRFKPS